MSTQVVDRRVLDITDNGIKHTIDVEGSRLTVTRHDPEHGAVKLAVVSAGAQNAFTGLVPLTYDLFTGSWKPAERPDVLDAVVRVAHAAHQRYAGAAARSLNLLEGGAARLAKRLRWELSGGKAA